MKKWSCENEKLVGKFFVCLWRAKKGIPKFFGCAGLFFVVVERGNEIPLKTVKYSNKLFLFYFYFFLKDLKNFSPAPGFFFSKHWSNSDNLN